MNPGEAATLVAVEFVPTPIALELVYRMGRAIGRREEISSLAHSNNNKLKKIYLRKTFFHSVFFFFVDRQKRRACVRGRDMCRGNVLLITKNSTAVDRIASHHGIINIISVFENK
jgi:hypothetical protein